MPAALLGLLAFLSAVCSCWGANDPLDDASGSRSHIDIPEIGRAR